MLDKYLGRKLDRRYEILELIGAGGMANVYKALDIHEDKIVAVKILRDEFLSNDEFVKRFKDEFKAIAVLSHPNIVKVYDISFSEKIQFIVMEYVNGITLKEYIAQEGRIGWKDVVHYSKEALRALQHAHDKGIVHRDIKPHNIMILADGSIKVMDFGIARFARSEPKTVTNRALGSVHYISPEQARGEITDERTDIYSVGVMMFEMLTGELPFDAADSVAVAIKQISERPKRPREINPNIPEGLEEIVAKAMQKDVSRRYHTASEMLKDLEEFRKNPNIRFDHRYPADVRPAMYYDAIVKKSKQKQTEEKPRPIPGSQKQRRKKEYDDEEAKSAVMPIMTGVALAFVLAAVVFVFYYFVINNPIKRVPSHPLANFVGLPYENVANSGVYGYKFVIVEQQKSKEYSEGKIYKQDPEPGKEVKDGSEVRVWVSTGIDRLSVPELSNLAENDARTILRNMNLYNVASQSEFSESVEEGKVIRTDPAFGVPVEESSRITLYVSKGPEIHKVKVPDLADLMEDAVREKLAESKLQMGTITPEGSDKPKGTVIGQDPPADTEVDEGAVINIITSSGEPPKPAAIGWSMPISLPALDMTATLTVKLNGETVNETRINLLANSPYDQYLEIREGDIIEVLINGDQFKVYNVIPGGQYGIQTSLIVNNKDAFEARYGR
ncbi:MAG: Stk1 family PASTA domain-containing Ser/Thr kinase [Oscillospiraceae bacterium]|jgi:serine/threonine-protein kinase|nr:Stk1 family PASTA domain-containing Ser/Thr kinase [Oscillospiraceae bacterium]